MDNIASLPGTIAISALEEACPFCHGRGLVGTFGLRCSECEGKGYMPTECGKSVLKLVARHFQEIKDESGAV